MSSATFKPFRTNDGHLAWGFLGYLVKKKKKKKHLPLEIGPVWEFPSNRSLMC